MRLAFQAIGWIAVVLTQVFYIPNTVRIIRTHDVEGYSLFGWLLLVVGLSCYLVYFISRGDVVGVVANACGVAGAGTTTICIWWWRAAKTVHGESPVVGEEAAVAAATANQG